MNKNGMIKISKDIMEAISLLAQKDGVDPKIYIEMILMKHFLKESINNDN